MWSNLSRLAGWCVVATAVTALGCDPAPTLPVSDAGNGTDTGNDSAAQPDARDGSPADVVGQDGNTPTDSTAGDGSAGDGAAGDGSAGDGSAGDGSAGDGSAGDGSADDGSAGDGSAGDAAVDAGCPMGQTMCAGACVDTATSLTNCGACGTMCAPAGATGACVMGMCGVASCNAGRADCNTMATDGCEVDLNASAMNCGRCGAACTFANATGVCTMGTCAIGTCNTGFGDCDSDPANGCETNLQTTTMSCGMCGRGCTLPNATAGCTAGACSVATCNTGFGDCDMNATNGCEAALNTNTNCGACGMACALGTRCSGGTCVSSCPMGTTFCTSQNICINTSSDLANCGACDNPCLMRANSSATCAAGACGFTCTSGYGDCDTMAANGCETNLNTTPASCGACGRACNLAHATAGCASGACTVASCAPGYGDCDGSPANGCEVDLNTNDSACGTCGNVCNLPNATPACAMGACTIGACNAGFADCDMRATNGCETSTTTNTNCGACGNVCAAGTRCAAGSCVSSCPTGTTYCPSTGVCADFQSDTNNCGMCGTVCPPLANASASCSRGTCGFTCNAGFADCDMNPANGCEANLATSLTACGACGRACSPAHATGACVTGLCTVVACATGFGDCDGDPSNGCETDLTSTTSACGVCTNSCRPANGTGVCTTGRCGVMTCDTGFGNCDMNAANGCETALNTNSNCGTCGRTCAAGSFCSGGTCVSTCTSPTSYCGTSMTCVDTTSDPANCGTCGRTCTIPSNSTATCASGTCGFSCNGSFANCDMNATNGCETDVNTSTANCGACGSACSLANAVPTCSGGACAVATCNIGFANCDSTPSNGCEVNTQTSTNNCGGCGNVCTLANATNTCAGGNCAIGSCNTGFGNCNGRTSDGCETALNTRDNCGACGNRCGTGLVCSGGTCVSACPTGTTFCGFGGCVDTTTNINACGSCGTVCPTLTNTTRTCTAGVCGATCNTGYGNCDGNAGNGCETNLQTSANNCGACGTRCNLANAINACSSGTCAIAACSPGFANCNTTVSDGCEVNLLNSNSNCGACGRACTGGQTCRTGVCR